MAATTETAAKERPIIMGPESVRAILAGTKTQTRRMVKPQHIVHLSAGCKMPRDFASIDGFTPCGAAFEARLAQFNVIAGLAVCPHGAAGNRLWVREAWRETGSAMMTSGKISPCLRREEVVYAADGEWDGPWRSPIFMPRWASRLALEVMAVRVERLNEITWLDALHEGIALPAGLGETVNRETGWIDDRGSALLVVAYRDLWESINGKGSWERNPWVWVVEFRRVTEGN